MHNFRFVLSFVLLLNSFFLLAQKDTIHSEKRIDAISIRPTQMIYGALVGDEVGIYYDRGINRHITLTGSIGYLGKSSEDFGLIWYFGSVAVPYEVLIQGQGIALRCGFKTNFKDRKNKQLAYLGLMSNFYLRHIANGGGTTEYDDHDFYTTAIFSGNSYHAGLNLIFGKQINANRFFIDFGITLGLFARRDYLKFTDVKRYNYNSPTTLVPQGQYTNDAGLSTGQKWCIFPAVSFVVKMGFSFKQWK